MHILKTWDDSDAVLLRQLMTRSFFDRRIEGQVQRIVEDVERRGDQAVVKYAERFDHVRLQPGELRVGREDIARARRSADKEFVSVFREIKRNLVSYHRRQKPTDWRMEEGNGGTVGERWLPLERVGVYVPAGKAPLISTVLMGVVPAKVAGVKEIVVVSPPSRNGEMNPYILAACAMLGVQEVYRMGGAQAIAAMAIGTQSVPRVDKIVGPGGIYVTMAKKLLYGRVGIDMVAGPSEILVLADESAEPAFVAADLLSQAEHGTGREVCVLVTDSRSLVRKVQKRLEWLVGPGGGAFSDKKKLLSSIIVVVTKDQAEAVEFANEFAAEHVEVMVKQPASAARRIRNAGAVFVGRCSPVPVGDFYAGPNHVLPTGGAARFQSGLSVIDFMKRVSLISYTKDSLRGSLPAVTKMAKIEGLEGHAEAVQVRFGRRRK
jgi:histidinol dehydrogenase